MSRIRAKNTKPELLVRKFLFSKGFRYRLNDNRLPGKPDIVLPKHRAVIFVHGCFWHGHEDCKLFVIPKTRTEWWLDKINTNKKNDAESIRGLKQAQWRTLTIWGCELTAQKKDKTLKRLVYHLNTLKTI